MPLANSLVKQMKNGLLIVFIILLFVFMASFFTNIFHGEEMIYKINQIERNLNHLKAAMKVDASRQGSLEGILNIINKYNPELAANEKTKIASEIYSMSVKYPNLDVNLICATITHESALSWQSDVTSWAGAIGLMQIMPATGEFLCELERIAWTRAEDILCDPILNIRLGCRYLSALIEMYDLEGGLAAYNGGEKRVNLWLANGRDNNVLYKETQGYIPAVLRFYEIFKLGSKNS